MTHAHSIKTTIPQFCAALALLAAVYSTPLRADPAHHSSHEHALSGSIAADGANEAARAGGSLQSAVRYTCPMHPEVVSDTPGRCPHCGMKLVEQEGAPGAWRQP